MPTDSTPPSFMPGLDFLKGLAAQAGKGLSGSLPGLGSLQQWVAPVLDPEELDKKIEELRTVHFWLEQNAKLLAATIQALEVQKMTLNTLRSMNVPFPDLKAAASGTDRAKPGSQEGSPDPRREARKENRKDKATGTPTGSATPEVAADAMKWWGALTEQFTQIASQAMAQVSATADRAGSAGRAAASSAVDKAGGAAAKAAAAAQSAQSAAQSGKSAQTARSGSAGAPAAKRSRARATPSKRAAPRSGRSDD